MQKVVESGAATVPVPDHGKLNVCYRSKTRHRMLKAHARMLGVSKNKQIIAISSLDEAATDAPDRLYNKEAQNARMDMQDVR